MDKQLRLVDLVPKRHLTFVLIFLGGLALIAGLEALYAWMPELAAMSTDGRVAAFDLDGEGSLAVCFSSALLAAAGLTSLLVYSIRRRRVDDYHGRYRIWLWAAMAWFLMAVDENASLHEGFKELMSHVTGKRLLGDGSLWWMIPYSLLLGYVGVRLLLDMRGCRSSIGCLLATAACYSVAIVAQLGWLLAEAGAKEVMLEEGAEMVGNLFLLLSMALHARHVILDAQGLLPVRAAKVSKKAAAASSEESASNSRKAKVEPSTVSARPPLKRSDLTAPAGSIRAGDVIRRVDPAGHNNHDDSESDEEQSRHRMSKAERKALRRQRERDRREID